MGTSHSNKCNSLAKQIWEWCINRAIWLSAAHIPGKHNVIADKESRGELRQSEWMINKEMLKDSLKKLNFKPDIDLFASRINKQYEKYVSYRPDPDAIAINAFSLDWANSKFYAFLLFSVILSVLSKMEMDQAEGICILPNWPTQAWYPKPITLKPGKSLLHLPPQESSPTAPKATVTGLPFIGQKLESSNLSSSAQNIIMSSWRSGTITQHKSYLERWEQFCIVNSVSVFEPDIGKVIEFLTGLFHTGIGYSAINTARSALSSIILLPDGRPVGEHPPYLSFSKGRVYPNIQRSGMLE